MSNKQSGGKYWAFVTGLFSIFAIIAIQFAFLFILLAMLPAIMAWFMDRTPDRSAFKTVFSCNLAGLLPSIMPIIKQAGSMKYQNIAGVMGDPKIWLMIYGGAAAGWCLVFLCRLIANLVITVRTEYHILGLERMQKKLAAEWGKRVAEPHGAEPVPETK
jgi:hypothetical protein